MSRVQLILAAVLTAALAGCSGPLNDPSDVKEQLGIGPLWGDGIPEEQKPKILPVGNQLELPTDLAMQAPTETVEDYQPNGKVEGYEEEPWMNAKRPDKFERYGISRFYPNGKPKNRQVLQEELRAAIRAEKRKTNPKYGTIWNGRSPWGN